MKKHDVRLFAIVLAAAVLLPAAAAAQGTRADYERANGLREKWQALAVNLPERPPSWIGTTHRFWYRKTVQGGSEFWIVDADAAAKRPAFDHVKLAAALAVELKDKVDPKKLPFMSITFADDEKSLTFEAGESRWKCDLASYALTKLGPAERRRGGGGGYGQGGPAAQAASAEFKPSPDGKWEAGLRNFNIFARSKEKDKKEQFFLSTDGSEGNYYVYESIVWSPDSKKIAAYRLKPGFHRFVHYVESSPADQLQPKYSTAEYAKPGDVLDIEYPMLFALDGRKQINVENTLFPNPYDQTPLVWRKDGRAFTFEYNQRGHEVYRIIEVDGTTGKARAVVNEEPKTFFCYSSKKYRFDLADGKELIWMSERDGWNHLYLVDGATGAVKNQITKGEWVVRGVDKVDEASHTIYFQAGGMNPGQDPYFVHAYRINFDGTGLTPLTEGNATHAVVYSSDMAYYTDVYSRIDLPTVMDVRRTSDRSVVMKAEKGEIGELIKAGWKAPEVFTAKGRDGKS